jgi:hypothetical protein
MSLAEFKMFEQPNVRSISGGSLGSGIRVRVVLTGGLGRLQVSRATAHFTDNVDSVTAEGVFLGLTEDKLKDLRDLLRRWVEWQTPLRYLDFGDRSMILEDRDNFVILPPGMRTIKIVDGSFSQDV